jgi:uncharacterized glyoxalase superfamily protein PhnB
MIESVAPILLSSSIEESVVFFEQKLGFTTALRADDYAIFTRDEAELHVGLSGDVSPAENPCCCYLRVTDARALYEDFKARGVDAPPPEAMPWGMTELHVVDPHGNLLKFGAKTQSLKDFPNSYAEVN